MESIADFGVLAMTGEIDIENVLPVLLFGGTGFNLGHVDLEGIEGLKGFNERARSVVDGKKNGSAIFTGGRTGFFADDEKARGVSGSILNGFLKHGELVKFCGERSSHRGGTIGGILLGQLGGLCGGGNFDEISFGKILENPITALAEDLWVGIEGLDFLAWNGSHKAVFDAEKDLGTDAEGGLDEEIQGVGDSSFG
jgi:hypothetical protein